MEKLKNIISLFLYGVKLRVVNSSALVINSALFIYAICTTNIREILESNIWILILIICFNIVWQAYSLCNDIIKLFRSTKHHIEGHISKGHFAINRKNYKQYQDSAFGINIIYDSTDNEILKEDTIISVKESIGRQQRIQTYIKQNSEVLLLFLKAKWRERQDISFFNESKLCQASEIYKEDGEYFVGVSKGCYYDSFVTNDIYCKKLEHQNGVTLYPPHNVTNHTIKNLDDTLFGNHIGVSTIAITKDNHMIILRQNNNSAISSNMYTASASGSVDYEDWKKSDNDLRQIIIRAAHRELGEETSISNKKRNLIQETKVIGVYRNLIRGGKPEYCCVTNLNISKLGLETEDLIKPAKKEVVDKIEFVDLNVTPNLNKSPLDLFIKNNKGCISPSLYMNIFFLKKHFGEEEKV